MYNKTHFTYTPWSCAVWHAPWPCRTEREKEMGRTKESRGEEEGARGDAGGCWRQKVHVEMQSISMYRKWGNRWGNNWGNVWDNRWDNIWDNWSHDNKRGTRGEHKRGTQERNKRGTLVGNTHGGGAGDSDPRNCVVLRNSSNCNSDRALAVPSEDVACLESELYQPIGL